MTEEQPRQPLEEPAEGERPEQEATYEEPGPATPPLDEPAEGSRDDARD